MTSFYNDDTFWVDDLEDGTLYSDYSDDSDVLLEVLEEEDHPHDEPEGGSQEPLVVSEDDVGSPDIMIVEEVKVPGSDALFRERDDEPEEEEPKTWKEHGEHSKFIDHVKDQMKNIPRHSGETVSGCERAKAFLKSLDSEISKAMRSDLKGVIDESEIDKLRSSVDDMMDRLEKQIKKLKASGKTADMNVRLVSEATCQKCASVAPVWHDTENNKLVCLHCEAETKREGLEKTATTPVLNVYMTPFERAVVGIMVNSKVSAGRNIEETYDKLKNKYNFTPREELAIQQLVADYGYPVYKDRGLLNEPHDPASGDGIDFMTNYYS